ncbi:MAG: tetratricopeptide repeat protein [Polyangiaceae bacterium]
MRRALRIAVLGGLLGVGCHAGSGARVQSDVRAFEREQSQERLLARGRAFADVGDTVRAQEYLAAALDAGGDEQRITPLLIAVCVRDGRYRLAIDYARRHLSRRPDDHRVAFLLGALYAGVGEGEAAEQELERVTRVDSSNAEARYALAVVLRDQRGDAARASRHFREYLKLSPRGAHAAEASGFGLERLP